MMNHDSSSRSIRCIVFVFSISFCESDSIPIVVNVSTNRFMNRVPVDAKIVILLCDLDTIDDIKSIVT